MADFTTNGSLGANEDLIVPETLEAVFKSRDQRWGILSLIPVEPTSVRDAEYVLIDSSNLVPAVVPEGDAAPLVKVTTSRIAVTAKKLAITLGMSLEQLMDSVANPAAFQERELLPGFAKVASAMLLGRMSGTTNEASFSRSFRATVTADAVNMGADGATSYRDAIATALATLDGRGVEANGAVLHVTARSYIRTTAREDGAGATSELQYNALSDLAHGLPVAVDRNLDLSGDDVVIGYVGDFSGARLKVYLGLETEESSGAIDSNGDPIFAGQSSMRFIVFRMRIAGGVVDAAKFVPIKSENTA